MRNIVKICFRKIFTFFSLKTTGSHGKNVFVNFPSKFTKKTHIGNNCHFNGMHISGFGEVRIGDNFHSGKNVQIITSYHNYDSGDALPYDNNFITRNVIIEENVWVGQNVIILSGSYIEEGAVIQAGSVVVGRIPACSIAGGHPAKVFKMRNIEHYNELKIAKKFF